MNVSNSLENEKWNDCKWTGTIRAFPLSNDNRPNNFDDYDERKKGESQWKWYE